MNAPPPPPMFLTAGEAVQLTRLSHDTLIRHAKRGEPLGLLRVGGRLLFDRDALLAWLRGHTTPPAGLPAEPPETAS